MIDSSTTDNRHYAVIPSSFFMAFDLTEQKRQKPYLDIMSGSVYELNDLKINHRLTKSLTKLLESIKQDVPEVQLISIVNSGGHLITSTQPELREDEFVLGAMTAAIINIAQQASLKLEKGEPTNIIIECPKGLIVLQYVNEQVLVAAVTSEGVRTDNLLSALNKAHPEFVKFGTML